MVVSVSPRAASPKVLQGSQTQRSTRGHQDPLCDPAQRLKYPSERKPTRCAIGGGPLTCEGTRA